MVKLPKITEINDRIVFNSRGDKTIEIDVISDNQFLGRACAPSGASVGMHEAQSYVKPLILKKRRLSN